MGSLKLVWNLDFDLKVKGTSITHSLFSCCMSIWHIVLYMAQFDRMSFSEAGSEPDLQLGAICRDLWV